jgi:hypothetical protein
MKKLLSITICLFIAGLSNSQTTFNYDNKGNMVSVQYNGTNACSTPSSTTTMVNNLSYSSTEKTESPVEVKIKLQVGPVPASSYINIQYEVPTDGQATIEIYNMLGVRLSVASSQFVWKGRINNLTNFNISYWANGTYYCILKTKEGNISKKFVKQ